MAACTPSLTAAAALAVAIPAPDHAGQLPTLSAAGVLAKGLDPFGVATGKVIIATTDAWIVSPTAAVLL